MSVPPTDPRYSTSSRRRFPVRPAPAITVFLLLLGIGIFALLAWWVF